MYLNQIKSCDKFNIIYYDNLNKNNNLLNNNDSDNVIIENSNPNVSQSSDAVNEGGTPVTALDFHEESDADERYESTTSSDRFPDGGEALSNVEPLSNMEPV